ncbi:hypothetical protein P872_12575 [Rhodonellum psychrophilum GCM71 = DSM 17998]|uniref:Uncharacterized protein n=1 Tax=Rhodonellum psychrophilum GCM71 = DSM 17998 TaxID=1123057 RepID=U5BXG2_9BACT|nr:MULTISPECIES: hypothetical protein [Rhodonellum]ERM80602.1 hypothetical protein P872_12575 [Rhodonellum psychrophilum GCM71 = DSM 17998]
MSGYIGRPFIRRKIGAKVSFPYLHALLIAVFYDSEGFSPRQVGSICGDDSTPDGKLTWPVKTETIGKFGGLRFTP